MNGQYSSDSKTLFIVTEPMVEVSKGKQMKPKIQRSSNHISVMANYMPTFTMIDMMDTMMESKLRLRPTGESPIHQQRVPRSLMVVIW